jgi:hypothetical protein
VLQHGVAGSPELVDGGAHGQVRQPALVLRVPADAFQQCAHHIPVGWLADLAVEDGADLALAPVDLAAELA